MSVLTKKSMLARLLARENITVEQTNHHTAYFDVDNRVLGLPYWKEVSQDLYDLLVGHEIGHALHTPSEGWHSSTTEIPGCPRSYVNIVEDIRIEKHVIAEFPGLLGSFLRGYQDLLDRDFFGIKSSNVNKLSFMNRLNIFAKARGLVTVNFSSKEQPYVDRAMAVETWEDVMNSCRELYAFMKEELEAQRKADEALKDALNSLGSSNGLPDKIVLSADKKKNDSGEKASEPMSKELKDAIKNGEVEIEVDVDSFKDQEGETADEADANIDVAGEGKSEDAEESDVSTIGDSENIEDIETDNIFRSAIANALVDSIASGGSNLYAKGPSKAVTKAVTSEYSVVAKSRSTFGDKFPERKYIKFNGAMKDVVSVMVKEFEMRKTARRFARARTSTKGSLDVNALHRYKYDDQLFKQVTHLDDDKSHGMVMLVDYSVSMRGIIRKVLKQILVLTTFCKRAGIPFEVYGFTNPGYAVNSRARGVSIRSATNGSTAIDMTNVHVFKLIDSSMSKKVYEEAQRALYMQTISLKWMGGAEQMNGTPLNQALFAMYHILTEFKAKHNVQKMTFITLTDGEGEGVNIAGGNDIGKNVKHLSNFNRIVDICGQKVTLVGYRPTPSILDGIRKMGIRTMNYHLISASRIKYFIKPKNSKVSSAAETLSESEAAVLQMKKDGCFVVDDNEGYDRQIFTAINENSRVSESGDVEEQDEDEEEAQFNSSVNDFADAFAFKAFAKKRDRLVATKFAEILS